MASVTMDDLNQFYKVETPLRVVPTKNRRGEIVLMFGKYIYSGNFSRVMLISPYHVECISEPDEAIMDSYLEACDSIFSEQIPEDVTIN